MLRLAVDLGWLPGARYTNLRDIRDFGQIGLIDIDWKNYNFDAHLRAEKAKRPLMTVARDIECMSRIEEILDQATILSDYCDHVILVPKDKSFDLFEELSKKFVFGYSVPTQYGGTDICTSRFVGNIHFLGGRPDVQYELGQTIPPFSIDGNRITLDAAFGKYFNGTKFLKHPIGGYERCVVDSLKSINSLWS